MTVNELLSGALVLYLQGGKGQELDYISRSESSSIGWYFWLKHSPGVYEIELKEDEKTGVPETNKADFFVRYYPSLEEPVLESYSVSEQIIRFDKTVFDDSLITVKEEEHEICPCCAAGSIEHFGHENLHGGPCTCGHDRENREAPPRAKGIPRMLTKFKMAKNLFMIGILTIQIKEKNNGFRALLKTKKNLITRAKEGIVLYQNEKPVELVEKGGIDRNIPGYDLGKRFMNFFVGQFLQKMSGSENQSNRREGLQETEPYSVYTESDIGIQYVW